MRTNQIPRIRDQFSFLPLTLPNAVLWFGLTALAYAGNLANFALSANLHFLFGTIPVLIILHFFGWGPAGVSAVIASVHTVFLWQHPLGIVVLTLEILAVGLFYQRRSGNLLLLDTAYWIVIGIPVVLLSSLGVMGAAKMGSLLLGLRMAVNGIFNALISSLVIALVEQVVPQFRHAPTRKTLGFAQAIFLVMVAFVVIPAMGILVFTARQEMTRVEQDVQTKLSITSFSARQAVNSWTTENFQTLRSLASFASQLMPGDLGLLRSELRLLNMSDSDFTALAVTDLDGRIIAAEPVPTASRLLGAIALREEPSFEEMISDLRGVISNAVFTNGPDDTPIVLFGVPVMTGDDATGAVVGVLDTLRLQDLLSRASGNWAVDVTISDGNDTIIASTNRMVPPWSSYSEYFPGPYDTVQPGLMVRNVKGPSGGPMIRRWQFSEYSARERLAMTSQWTINLHAAVAPYQNLLNDRYRSLFFVMIAVIIFTTLLSAFVSRKMLGSLVQLTAVAEDLPEKVVRQEVPAWPVSRIAEINTLIQCFRITSEQLVLSFTKLQAANEELSEAKQQAELANRTKSEFLANISHDLRTPLNGILGYAQILARDTSLDDQTKNAVAIIEKSGNHLLNLINDILDVSRIEADKLRLDKEPFFLGSFLDDIADIVSLQARQKGLELRVDFADDLPAVVLGDEKRLRQILLNLLNNAVKFTHKGHVRFAARFSDELLHVEVEDTGIGIPENEQEAIFSPFKQLMKHIQSEEGTGLGLAIVSRLVKMMNGEVHVESTPGAGSRFSVALKLAVTDMVPPGPQSVSTITGYQGPVRTVLVVDDKERNRSVLRNMLEPLGFAVEEANDGEAGINAIRGESPDMVLMDLVMPNLDGFDAIRAIREDTDLHDVPVIAISASVASSIRDECLRIGFNDFIPKPFREPEMLNAIGKLLKLEWIHRRDQPEEAEAGTPVDSPSGDDLDELIEQARSGNIRGVVDAADELASRSEIYRPFSRSVTAMAQSFQIDKLIDYLDNIRQEQEEHVE